MSRKVKIEQLSAEIVKGLQEYADLTTENMKKAVRKTANSVKKDISAGAPKNTGKYVKSWATKKTEEVNHRLVITVHSKKYYRLTHLLENGHALRNGGRTRAYPHIRPAENRGEEMLLELLGKAIK